MHPDQVSLKLVQATANFKELGTTPAARLLLTFASKRGAIADAFLISHGGTSSTGEPDGYILENKSPRSFRENKLKWLIIVEHCEIWVLSFFLSKRKCRNLP